VAGKWLCIGSKYAFTCVITSVLQHHVMKACMLCALVTCWIHNRMAIGFRLDMAAKRERHMTSLEYEFE
jgi:hypothetical protein